MKRFFRCIFAGAAFTAKECALLLGAGAQVPLFGLFLIVVEALAFFLVGKLIGFGWALLALIGLWIIGVVIAGWQIRSLAIKAAQDQRHPGKLTGNAALSIAGGWMVAAPGFVSSALGLLLLLPPTRSLIRRKLGKAMRRAVNNFSSTAFTLATSRSMPDASERIPGWGEVIDHRDDEFRAQ